MAPGLFQNLFVDLAGKNMFDGFHDSVESSVGLRNFKDPIPGIHYYGRHIKLPIRCTIDVGTITKPGEELDVFTFNSQIFRRIN